MEGTSLLPALCLAVALSASLTVVGNYFRAHSPALFLICKPLTTILILAVALLPGTFPSDPYAGAIALGLSFSLCGDIFLMLPGNRFLPGLACFLAAHLCYCFAFLISPPATGFPWPVIPLSLIGIFMLTYLWPPLSSLLRGAISLYIAVIVTMGTLAVHRALAGISMNTLSAAIGALLFMMSDGILAISRFRRPFHLSQAVVLGSYYAGQLLIALSIGLRTFH